MGKYASFNVGSMMIIRNKYNSSFLYEIGIYMEQVILSTLIVHVKYTLDVVIYFHALKYFSEQLNSKHWQYTMR